MVAGLLGALPTIAKLRGSTNDDWIDRMSHVWTVFLFVIFALVVGTGQLVGEPIHCWFPAEFKDPWEAYGKYYCWIKNTYYIPMDTPIPIDQEERSAKEITYYQWVPLILVFQAFMFKFPNLIWRIFNGGSGLNLDKIVDMASTTQLVSPAERKETIYHLAKYMDKWLETHREYRWNMMVRIHHRMSQVCCFVCNKRAGTYLTSFYLFIKVIFVANAICQFFLLNAFMSSDYSFYGFEVMDKLSRNEPWRESPRFPRITLCDFKIRQLQNILPYTVQCVLPINLFNEKIFIFLWFWLCFISALAAFSLISWMILIVLKRNRPNYVRKFLKISDELHTGFDKKLSHKFANTYLRDDGVFVLRVVAKNSTDMVVTDLVTTLWQIYKEKQNTRSNEVEPNDDPKEPLA